MVVFTHNVVFIVLTMKQHVLTTRSPQGSSFCYKAVYIITPCVHPEAVLLNWLFSQWSSSICHKVVFIVVTTTYIYGKVQTLEWTTGLAFFCFWFHFCTGWCYFIENQYLTWHFLLQKRCFVSNLNINAHVYQMSTVLKGIKIFQSITCMYQLINPILTAATVGIWLGSMWLSHIAFIGWLYPVLVWL